MKNLLKRRKTMEIIKLEDLWSKEEVQELKSKLPLLPKIEQRRMMFHLEESLSKTIEEKLPDIKQSLYYSLRILLKEFPFCYLP